MKKDELYTIWGQGEQNGVRLSVRGKATRRGIKRLYKRGLLPRGVRVRRAG